ncbi:hypothetical protein [Arthrobacter sp. zg-Y1143]|uniref:hypothetical protein n=1 Tax=Arthrobacter sp. zg-Y1143 TaxID=3049065 RepID=UPI0024C2A0CF|nr:hypothetical protein [Arthrobacter sp. zg-Y1143]MDK1327541.1 hypothetical protein [Arthrobacter sp. zg-Y1143]
MLIARRREAWISFCVLLVGLPVTAVVCFAWSQAEHAAYVAAYGENGIGGGLFPMLLAFEAVGTWFVLAFAEIILRMVLPPTARAGAAPAKELRKPVALPEPEL